jgi:hypothetical protein
VDAARRVKHSFGKKHLGLELGEIFDKDKGFIAWLADIDAKGDVQLREKQAAMVLLGRDLPLPDSDIPF